MADLPYISSEELQRHNAEVFARDEANKKQATQRTEKDKVKDVLDIYIAKHNSTKEVRAMAKEQKRGADYQLDLSADIAEILIKIKSELK